MLDCLCNGIEGFIYPQSISLAQRLFESLGILQCRTQNCFGSVALSPD